MFDSEAGRKYAQMLTNIAYIQAGDGELKNSLQPSLSIIKCECFITVFFFSPYIHIISFLEQFENEFQNYFPLLLNTLIYVSDICCCRKKYPRPNYVNQRSGIYSPCCQIQPSTCFFLYSPQTKNEILYTFKCLKKIVCDS